MADLVQDILDASLAQPPEAALAVMRLSLADWLAVGMAGRDEPVSRITRDMVREEGGAAQATLFGGGQAPMRAAALVNGACSHALDYDDTHFAHIGHPSVAVLPAALAVAEARGTGGEEMLRAALAGCEASVRFGLAFGRGHYQAGFHQTATAGAFGATVAAGVPLGLGPEQMRHALGLVSTRASGLKSQFGTMGKPLNAGIAASNGVEAAQLAARGFISAPEAVEGALGFLDTHHADGAREQPPGFMMTGVSHKYHACCHGLHAALEALRDLGPLNAVQRVEVRTHPRWLSVCDKPAPRTGLEAKFSYRGVIALALCGHDTAALDSFADGPCQRPEVIALRDRVRVIGDDTLAETEAALRVQLAGGWQAARHDLAGAQPLEARVQRLRGKLDALLGEARASRVWSAAQDTDIKAITGFMAQGAH